MSHIWHWPFSSPWSQVLMAFSLQNVSALLRITGHKCPATHQATLEKCQHKDFKLNNSVVLIIQLREKTCVRTPCPWSYCPMWSGWDGTQITPGPIQNLLPPGSCLVFNPLNHHNPSEWWPLHLEQNLSSWGLQGLCDHGLSLHPCLVPLDLLFTTAKHPDLLFFPGTFQILPCTKAFTQAISSAWNMTTLVFPVPVTLQDLVQMMYFQKSLGHPIHTRAHIHFVTHDFVPIFQHVSQAITILLICCLLPLEVKLF